MAGFPVTISSNTTSRKLLQAGHRVAICEQVEEPAPPREIIHREVTRVVTPGHGDRGRPARPARANHLVAVCPGQGNTFGLAWVELSTGEFSGRRRAGGPAAPTSWAASNAAECLFAESARGRACTRGRGRARCPRRRHGPARLDLRPADRARRPATTHFHVTTLAGFGFDDDQPCLTAAGACSSTCRRR